KEVVIKSSFVDVVYYADPLLGLAPDNVFLHFRLKAVIPADNQKQGFASARARKLQKCVYHAKDALCRMQAPQKQEHKCVLKNTVSSPNVSYGTVVLSRFGEAHWVLRNSVQMERKKNKPRWVPDSMVAADFSVDIALMFVLHYAEVHQSNEGRHEQKIVEFAANAPFVVKRPERGVYERNLRWEEKLQQKRIEGNHT